MSRKHVYPALEQLKQEAGGRDVLIEVAPTWLEEPLEYVLEIDYLEQKQEIFERREEVREQFSRGSHQIESIYGTVVNRALRRRLDGKQPSLEISRLKSELEDAKNAIDDLRDDLDYNYLTAREHRKLQNFEEDILDAREYVRTKQHFNSKKPIVTEEIIAFDERFERYSDKSRYMISSDEEYLIAQSEQIWEHLSDLSRELKLHVLPDEDAAWLGEKKSRFNALVDALPEYNEAFVEREREEYADVLTSSHGPLNDRQQKAVIRNDRRNLVDASAGTGKTLTLTHRFIYLLEKGVSPRRIISITYMTDAAEEMKSRIAEMAEVPEDRLNISTIHSFARKISMEAAETGSASHDIGEARKHLVDQYLEAALNDEKSTPDQYPRIFNQFSEAINEFYIRDQEKEYINTVKPFYESWDKFVRDKLEEFIEEARTFELSADDIRENLDESHAIGHAFSRAGASLVEAYEQIVADEPTPTDFDDMIQTARQVVQENPEAFGRRYDHILVDEYQDMSESTLEFIDALAEAKEDTHLFCVGDDWQSIMGFAGSNVRYFTGFEERYEDVTYTSLKINYRCPPKIVDAGCELIAESQADQNDKPVEAASNWGEVDDGRTMQLHLLDGLYNSRVASYAADRVERALEEGYDYQEVMVLSRNDENSKYMQKCRQELESRGIPHTRPNYTDDYLPEEIIASHESEMTLNNGDATFANPDIPDKNLPLVTVQSVHSSKGTEASVVIFLHAVGDVPDGIPIEERVDPLIQPATNITSNHVPEERRLFYVALTRAKEQFQAIAKADKTSQFVQDIEEYFELIYSKPEIRGTCTSFDPPQSSNHPYKATLDCGSFEADLFAWPDKNPQKLVVGAKYRIKDPVINKSSYGEEIRYDRSEIERIS